MPAQPPADTELAEVAPVGSWRHLLHRHPSAFLLFAQLLSLVAYAWMNDTRTGRWLFGALALCVVLLAVWVINKTPAITRIGWMLAVPAMVLTFGGLLFDDYDWLIASAVLEALLYFYAAISLVAYMLADQQVSRDELFAAGATFTLLAWGFAYAYLVCQAWFPGSFTGFEPDRDRTWLELLFLSFTVLSATGLGDVLPVSPQARVLVMLEEIVGVGYLAMVVSRLIGLTMLRHARRTD